MFDRKELMNKYRGMVASGEPIIGGGAGTGLSAKCEEAGGIDLIVIYNSRSLPHGGAREALRASCLTEMQNGVVMEMAGEGAACGSRNARSGRRLCIRSISSHGPVPGRDQTGRVFRCSEFPDGRSD